MIKGVAAGFLGILALASASAQAAPLVRESVVVLMRHGLRPPTKDPAMPKGVAAQDWPRWDVPPGWLTAHGGRAVEVLGRDDARWLAIKGCAGLRIVADSDQRTIATAQHWAKGALACTPAIDHLPQDQEDPRFNPLTAGLAMLDPVMADTGVAQEVGPGGLAAMDARMKSLLVRMDAVLCGETKVDAECGVSAKPSLLRPASETAKPKLSGALDRASTAAQILLLEYGDGKPMADVGWGRAKAQDIAAFSTFHAEEFRLLARPRAIALPSLAGLMPILRQGLSGRGITLISGHDTQIANLAGALGVHWQIPGFAADDPAPGGAIVLEVLRGAGGKRFVRATYRAQGLEEIRNGGRKVEHQPMAMACGSLCPLDQVIGLLTQP